ncbi:hypothetical protein HK104_006459 [Borealophlyctis nickersoniae]|nr:hypothetical protein HK104_006459 [Borealophlyctis nickersoniae]
MISAHHSQSHYNCSDVFRIGGTVGAAVTCPLEVVKTRLQSSLYRGTETSVSFRNPLRAAWHHVSGVANILGTIRRQEGIRALWKGLGPNLIGVVPARATYFAVYTRGKHVFAGMNGGVESPWVHMLSAACAGTAVATVTNPIWLVKTRMQLQSEDPALRKLNKYKNSFHCAYSVLKEEGIRGWYRGYTASLLGLTESTLQFVTYEELKKRVALKRLQESERLLREPGGRPEWWTYIPPWMDTFLVAASAKLGAAIVTYPHEVLRTRLRQTPEDGIPKYTGLIQSAKLIYKEEGFAALYGGMTAHLLRVVPNAAILFFCYEFVVSLSEKDVLGQLRKGFSNN